MSIRKLVLAAAMVSACGAAKADIIASEKFKLDDLDTVYFMLSDQEVHGRGRCLDVAKAKEAVVWVVRAGRSYKQFPGCYSHTGNGKIGLHYWELGEGIDKQSLERDLSKFQKTEKFKGW